MIVVERKDDERLKERLSAAASENLDEVENIGHVT